MAGSNKSRERVEPGTLPRRLPQLELSRGLLADRGEIEATSLAGTLPGIDAPGLSLETVRLSIKVVDSSFERMSAKETRWEGCDLSNCRMPYSSLRDTAFCASRMTGINFAESTLTDTLIDDCKLDLSSFRFARISAVTFQLCDLTAADFANAQLTGVRSDRCNLSGAQFSQATMKNVDLRGSELNEIAGIDGLAGAIVTTGQLLELSPLLAAQAGLTVQD